MLTIQLVNETVTMEEQQVLNCILVSDKKILIQFCDLTEKQINVLRRQHERQNTIWAAAGNKDGYKERLEEYAMTFSCPTWSVEQAYIKNFTEGALGHLYFAEILIKFKSLNEK